MYVFVQHYTKPFIIAPAENLNILIAIICYSNYYKFWPDL
jgi:hypothetical protein